MIDKQQLQMLGEDIAQAETGEFLVEASGSASQWISVKTMLPESTSERWSKDVIAMTDTGRIFRLACIGDYWQRSSEFLSSDSRSITHWMPLNEPDD